MLLFVAAMEKVKDKQLIMELPSPVFSSINYTKLLNC
jgi:hypothetical protein